LGRSGERAYQRLRLMKKKANGRRDAGRKATDGDFGLGHEGAALQEQELLGETRRERDCKRQSSPEKRRERKKQGRKKILGKKSASGKKEKTFKMNNKLDHLTRRWLCHAFKTI